MSIDEMMDLGFSDQLINQLTEIAKETSANVQQIIAENGGNGYEWN